MVRRHQAAKFAADVFVFPGGTVRADDHLDPDEATTLGLDPGALHAALDAHQDPFALEPDGGLSLWVAALRELFEEAGVLLAENAGGALADLSAPDRADHFQALRDRLQGGRLSLAELGRREGLLLAAERLVYFSRWITPSRSPRRYDTRFFVAEVPAGHLAGHCQIETTDGVWISPRDALARQASEDFPMLFVTREHVKRLAEFRRTEALIEFTRNKPISAILPSLEREHPSFASEPRQWW